MVTRMESTVSHFHMQRSSGRWACFSTRATLGGMVIHQVPITAHPLLTVLATELARQPRVPVPMIRGFREHLAAGPPARHIAGVPQRTMFAAPLEWSAEIRAAVKDGWGFDMRAIWYCPAGGGIGWHTNSDRPGWRVYVVRSPRLSRFLMPGQSICDRDGFANIFEIPPGGAWHAVDAIDERWSGGVRVPEHFARTLIERG